MDRCQICGGDPAGKVNAWIKSFGFICNVCIGKILEQIADQLKDAS